MGLLLSLFLAVSAPLFSHFGVQDGLSQATVFSIVQDSRGEMWFGTYDGLNRFNSFDIKVYRHDEQDPYSVSGNLIWHLDIDPKDRLWVASDLGVDVYDRWTDRFHNVFDGNDLLVSGFSFMEDGRVLMGSNKGTYIFTEHDDGVFSCEPYAQFRSSSRCVFAKHGQDTYMAKMNSGIYVIHGSDLSAVPIEPLKDISAIMDIAVHDDQIYISTNGTGLYRYDISSGALKRFSADGKPGCICSDHVRAISVAPDGSLWIATGNGVSIMDRTTGQCRTVLSDRWTISSLSNNSVKSVCRSSDGGMWLGTYYGGVNYYNPAGRRFLPVDYSHGTGPLIVGGISEDVDGTIWIGTNRHGLYHYSPSEGWSRRVRLSNDPEAEDIKRIVPSSDGRSLYVCCALGGLSVYSRAYGRVLDRYLQANMVYDVVEEAPGRLWICTMSGIFFLDEKRKAVSKVEIPDGRSLPAFRLIRVSDGSFRIAAENSYVRCNLSVGEDGLPICGDFYRFPGINKAQDVMQAKDGTVWIATRNGFFREEADSVSRQYISDNSNFFRGIEEDASSRLWITSENGLFRFDPADGSVIPYTVADGLPDNSFCNYAHLLASDGVMYVGGLSGAVSFAPDSLGRGTCDVTPFVELIVSSNDGHVIPLADPVFLPHSQNSIDVTVAAIDYVSWGNGDFEYRLVGYDSSWRRTGSSRRISYSNLPGGQYTLEMRYLDASGVASVAVSQLQVKVRRPWYSSFVAVLLYSLLALSFIYGIVIYFIFRTDEKNRSQIEELKTISEVSQRDALCLRFASTTDVSDANYEFLKKAYEIVMDHLSDESFSVDQLSDCLGLTRTRVYVRIKEITGDSALNFVKKIRFDYACRLLTAGDLSIAEIGYKVGFRTPAYFSTSFKAYVGVTPKQYASGQRA